MFDFVHIDVFKDASGFLVSGSNELPSDFVTDIESAGFENPGDHGQAITQIGKGPSSIPKFEMDGAGPKFLPKFFKPADEPSSVTDFFGGNIEHVVVIGGVLPGKFKDGENWEFNGRKLNIC
jgi:hypothetical protein